jgi:hypothetical protein
MTPPLPGTCRNTGLHHRGRGSRTRLRPGRYSGDAESDPERLETFCHSKTRTQAGGLPTEKQRRDARSFLVNSRVGISEVALFAAGVLTALLWDAAAELLFDGGPSYYLSGRPTPLAAVILPIPLIVLPFERMDSGGPACPGG